MNNHNHALFALGAIGALAAASELSKRRRSGSPALSLEQILAMAEKAKKAKKAAPNSPKRIWRTACCYAYEGTQNDQLVCRMCGEPDPQMVELIDYGYSRLTPDTYLPQHERLSADDLYKVFKAPMALRYSIMRRYNNQKLKQKATPPNRANYQIVHEGDEEYYDYLEAVSEASAAQAVLRARRGRDLDQILRGMTKKDANAYLYRTED
jgi:hypothetical protein